MKSQDLKKYKIPDSPGVYFFRHNKKVLYIGKASSLKDRIKSYFSNDLIKTRGSLIVDMIFKSNNIDYIKSQSVLDALILEASLIKKYRPNYNTKEKDNKSFNYVCITKDSIPRVLVKRERGLDKTLYSNIYGPFTNGNQLKEAMKIIRRIFPYFDNESLKKNNKEFYNQIGIVPDENNINYINNYKNNIKEIKLLFNGKKKDIILNLKKKMKMYSSKLEFEKANLVKKKIFALTHINDVSLIKNDLDNLSMYTNFRIEGYDVAHLNGKNIVGVMTVMENGEMLKSEYKKFNIKNVKNIDDIASLKEIIERRFKHKEWTLPNLLVLDGNIAHLNIVKKTLNTFDLKLDIVSVVKNEKHKPKAILGLNKLINKYKKEILLVNSEAHRFAITFHRKKRANSFLKK